MKFVAVIPARGGSKGMPGKNTRVIAGRSLLQRAINCCQASSAIDETYVSSEDYTIRAHAKRCGAMTIKRPAELAKDETRIDPVLLNALEYIACDVLVLVQCTSPFLTTDEITASVNRLRSTGADVTVAVAPTDAFQVRVGSEGYLEGVGFDISNPVTRRQDRPPCYEIAGTVWAIDAAKFKSRGKLYSDRMNAVFIQRRWEIDEPWQFESARRELECPSGWASG